MASAMSNQARPSNTLYCANLPDKLQKDDLKRALYMLFSVYGPILDIVALKTAKMRGQAHILFRDVSASTQAMRGLQGSDFFGKDIKITYAKAKSDTLAKLDGTFKQPVAPSSTAAATSQTSLQQSVFAGPPGTTNATSSTTTSAPPPSLKTVPNGVESASATISQGVKRTRDESESEKEDEPPMDMDDEAMEESDED